MGNLTAIEQDLTKRLNQIDEVMQNFPWQSRDHYANWLSQTYYYVCHSTRLLCLTGAYVSQADNRFHLRGIEHMKEEKSHEKLALRDLQNLGFAIDQFEEHPITQALYQTVSYSITDRDPLAIYGYILLLEGVAVHSVKGIVKKVLSAYPNQKVASFLEVHGDEDPDHLVKAFKILEGLETSRLAEVHRMLKTSHFYYQEMVQVCAEGKIERTDYTESINLTAPQRSARFA